MRSPTLLLIRMKAADTKASSAMADWTPLAVVSRSRTTAEIDTFIRDVSTTRTNIAAASRTISRRPPGLSGSRASSAEPVPMSPSRLMLRCPRRGTARSWRQSSDPQGGEPRSALAYGVDDGVDARAGRGAGSLLGDDDPPGIRVEHLQGLVDRHLDLAGRGGQRA